MVRRGDVNGGMVYDPLTAEAVVLTTGACARRRRS